MQGPDFVALYASSDLLTANQQTLAAACEPSGPAPAAAGGTYAASAAVQLRQLLGRQATRLWRLPSYSALRLAVAVAFALVLGTLYWNKGQASGEEAYSGGGSMCGKCASERAAPASGEQCWCGWVEPPLKARCSRCWLPAHRRCPVLSPPPLSCRSGRAHLRRMPWG